VINVFHIKAEEDLKSAYDIREKVYIEEQQIDRADEFDEFDETSEHFLAKEKDAPCGTARYRFTNDGIKLERFAVLPEFRKRGVASLLMQSMLEHATINNEGQLRFYLNAQVDAMPLYTKFGFEPVGDRFMECDIEHQQMEREV